VVHIVLAFSTYREPAVLAQNMEPCYVFYTPLNNGKTLDQISSSIELQSNQFCTTLADLESIVAFSCLVISVLLEDVFAVRTFLATS
jgi:hypothetical protein